VSSSEVDLRRALLRVAAGTDRSARLAAEARDLAQEIEVGRVRFLPADTVNQVVGFLLQVIRHDGRLAQRAREVLALVRRKR
jgi:hypothetical protein